MILSGFPLMWEEEAELRKGRLTQWPTCHMSEGIVDGGLCTWRVVLEVPFGRWLRVGRKRPQSREAREARGRRVSKLTLPWKAVICKITSKKKACPFNGQSQTMGGRAERGWAVAEREPSVPHPHPADVWRHGFTATFAKKKKNAAIYRNRQIFLCRCPSWTIF